jgi:exosortase A
MRSAPSPAAAWRRTYLILGGSLVLLVAIFWSTATSTVALWFKAQYSHSFLVVPIAAYLAWQRRGQVESSGDAPAFWALPALAALAFVWLLGRLTATEVVQHFCLAAMMIVIVWGIVGTRGSRPLLFPLVFLLFAVPMGERLIPTLQDFTARLAGALLRLTGVPVFLEGHVLAVPGAQWQVAQACSGIAYLFASLSVGFLYAGLAYRTWRRRTAFFVAAGVVPILANGLRVYTVILIAALGGAGIATGIEHYLYGWMFFAMIMGLLFAVAGWWKDDPPTASVLASHRARSAAHPAPVWRTAAFAVLALAVAGVAPLSAAWLSNVPPNRVDSWRAQPPAVFLPWRLTATTTGDWTPKFEGATREFLQTYVSGAREVRVYVAYFDAGDANVKLATVGNVLFSDPWSLVGESRSTIRMKGRSFSVPELSLRSQASSLIVWHWYSIDGTLTGNDYLAKVLLAKARLFRSRQDPAAIVVAARSPLQLTDQAAVLQDFLDHASFAGSQGATD